METETAGLLLDQVRDRAVIADLCRALADVADQERHLVRLGRMLAEHEGVDRFQLVDEPVLEQEVERAINGGRRGTGMAVPQRLQEVIGLDGFARPGDQYQHFPPQRRQAQAACAALVLDRKSTRLNSSHPSISY